jgi:hypothetical protein
MTSLGSHCKRHFVATLRGTSRACTQNKRRPIALRLHHHARPLQTYGLTCPYKIVCDVAVLGNPQPTACYPYFRLRYLPQSLRLSRLQAILDGLQSALLGKGLTLLGIGAGRKPQ